jgi:hypothetical protein
MSLRHIVFCGLPCSDIFFSTLSHRRQDCQKKKAVDHKMSVLIFSTNLVWNFSHSKKNLARYDHTFILVFTWSARYSCQILMKLKFSRQIFEKYPNVIFHENNPSGNRVVPCGRTERRTDRHDEANSRSSQFCETPKNDFEFIHKEILLYYIKQTTKQINKHKNIS